MKSNSRRKNKATRRVKAHNVKKGVQRREAAAAKAREASFSFDHPAAVALGKIWDGFDVPIESVDVFLFWEKKDGVWLPVPDGDLVYKVDAETKGYWGRRRDKKTGEWKPEWRKVEVSKEAIKKAREEAEKKGVPFVELVPTSCEKFEVQFSPHHLAYANRKMAKIRASILAVGGSKSEADKAADQWAIGVITRAVPKLGEYLEWRSGRRVFLMPLHTISGKWHLTPWTTYVGLDGHIQGLVQVGRGGRTIVGYESQLDAGYELPPHRLEIYKRKLAIEKSRAKRYPDKRFVDVGLSDVLLKHMRAEMEAAGDQELWEEACGEYRAALVKAEPLKVELEKFKADRLAEYLDRIKGAGNRRREVAIDEKAASVSERLNEVLSDEEMRELVKVYPLKKIAALVVDQLVKIKELAAWATESLARLLAELARLFKVDQVELVQPVEEAGPKVLPASPATEEDLELLPKWRALIAKSFWVPSPQFAHALANVEGGLTRFAGLTGSQAERIESEVEGMRQVLQEAAQAVPTTATDQDAAGERAAPPVSGMDESPDLGAIARARTEAEVREALQGWFHTRRLPAEEFEVLVGLVVSGRARLGRVMVIAKAYPGEVVQAVGQDLIERLPVEDFAPPKL
jgi:hypothetical protein